MRNSRRLLVSLVLVGLVTVGSTLAYLTDKDNAVNTITVGKIGINLSETSNTDNVTSTTSGLIFNDPILPGGTVSKIPVIKLDNDSADSYLRVKIEVVKVNDEKELPDYAKESIINYLTGEMNKRMWTLSDDGYYYYQGDSFNKGVCTPNEEYTLFTDVHFSENWKNDVMGAKFGIKIQAQAIQAKHFDPVRDTQNQNIISWGNIEV